jgi:hypothetical protein
MRRQGPPPEVIVLRHVRAKVTRNSQGNIIPEVPTRLTPEQERDLARKQGTVIPIRK